MIKLDRTPKPVELTTKLQKELTTEFKLTGKSVWNLDFIKKGLLDFSNNKCCYCEANIKEESKYLEVEHFHHKDKYKDEVLEWKNLLPSCKKCNGTKNNHDTIIEPIIDPSLIDPKDHLKYWRYRIKGVDDLGKLTVSVLNLNDQDRLVIKRFEIGNAIQDKLEQLNELIDDYISGIQTSTRRKNRIVNGIKNLMKEGLPKAIYSATSATIILTDTEYNTLKNKLTQQHLWDSELKQLEIDISKGALKIEK
ncbi:HNH endonuclease [Tenacibaculum mesophilum]|uniref:HNH endonuclease n=1 Tax=Tenacibaculum mesophilum TaxID=104268 RepID=UPI001431A36E|nr:HNH endonuclease [Tenacibaculum mesophilum]KAF9659840.1 HNH endonuclease [Tenacibaculum mesophilum]